MNDRERKAIALWKKNSELDFSNMSAQELTLRAKQQDRLYLMAHSRTDKYLLKQLKEGKQGIKKRG